MRIFRIIWLLALPFVAWADFEVYFLRHGETTWNRAKILQGSVSNTVLTARGVRMAERTAEGMTAKGVSFDRVYASPYLRAWRTAELVAAKIGPAPVRDSRLCEMGFGKYEGLRYERGAWPDDNLRRFFEDPETYVPQGAGAESLAQVQARVLDFLEDEIRPLDGKVKRVLCVAHSLVLRALVRGLAGDGAPEAAKTPIQRNCCVHVVRFSAGRYSLVETGRVFYDPAEFERVPEPRLVAHRGASDLTMPEASRPAYRNAVTSGSDIVKLDLQRTRDGVIVMGHDPTLSRNMGWDVRIADVDYAEILEKGTFIAKGGYAQEKILRLDETLDIVKPVPEFWIDFKAFDPDFAERVLEAFKTADIDESRIMVATFSKPALKYFQSRHPNIRRVGHVSFKRLADGSWKGNAGQGATIEDMMACTLRYRDQLGLFGVNMPVLQGQTRPQDVEFLRKNGLWVSLWFVQNAKSAATYRTCGADAFVTDFASHLRLEGQN